MKKLVTLNLMGSSNGRRVSVKYKKGAKERMVHFWPEKKEKWKLSSGYVPHHMKNLKRACKLFLEAYAFPLFERGGPGMFDSPSSLEWSDLFQEDQPKTKLMQRLLKITDISDVKVAKNGRKYRTLVFESDTRLDDGTPIFSNMDERSRNIREEFKDSEGREFKADGLYNLYEEKRIKIGSMVDGRIVKVATTGYLIAGDVNEKFTRTEVVFAHEDPTDYILKQLPEGTGVRYGDQVIYLKDYQPTVAEPKVAKPTIVQSSL